MRLDLQITKIRGLRFGDRTAVADGVLSVNRQELQDLLSQDRRFAHVEIELARPGESCRIVQVWDIAEPRAKVPGGGSDFPGVLGKMRIAGSGRSRVLRGAAVVLTDQVTPGRTATIIDMSGPGALRGAYGATQNVVIVPQPSEGISVHEYQLAMRLALLKTAVYLASAAMDLSPDEVETYELPSETETQSDLAGLPRVAYLYQIHSHQFPTARDEPVLYGDSIPQLIPTILHPNEVLDGAIVRAFWGRGCDTYMLQNHPMITELYRRHGREINFVGVVGLVAHVTEPERERSAAIAAHLAKHVLGAEAAVLTKIGGGAPHVDLALAGERCEELGIKTVLVVEGMGYGVDGGQMIFNSPAADAIVNIGWAETTYTIPSMDRLVGAIPGMVASEAAGERTITQNMTAGCMNQLGGARLQSVIY